MTQFLLALTLVLAIMVGILLFIVVQTNKENEANEKFEKENREKNELKESMDSGNSAADFNASVHIMHDLAQKK